MFSMSPLVKRKRQANFKILKILSDLEPLRVRRTKKRCIQLVRVSRFTRVLNWPTRAKKPQFTQGLVK
jgi:3-methyladenine DNA glycosylase AlkC